MKRLTHTCAQRNDQIAVRTDDVVAFHTIRTEIRAQISMQIRTDFRCLSYILLIDFCTQVLAILIPPWQHLTYRHLVSIAFE